MATRDPLAVGEWYHCFNRGVEKRTVFETDLDYKRFLQLLYLANSREKLHRSALPSLSEAELFCLDRREPLVGIGAYCLMSNHFHLLLHEIAEGGIVAFMQKLGTAYTMYFNIKNERTGNLFMKPFRSKHIHEDRYFQHVVNYIHCNPAELYEPKWKEGRVRDLNVLVQKLETYPFSSLGDFSNENRTARSILDQSIFQNVEKIQPATMVQRAQEYYAEIFKATP